MTNRIKPVRTRFYQSKFIADTRRRRKGEDAAKAKIKSSMLICASISLSELLAFVICLIVEAAMIGEVANGSG